MLLTFKLADEFVKVKIENNSVTFTNSSFNFQNFVSIDGLKLSRDGILKEHPDLKNMEDSEMKAEAIKRFKEHIKNLGGENKVKDYLIKELGNSGYELKLIEQPVFRSKKP